MSSFKIFQLWAFIVSIILIGAGCSFKEKSASQHLQIDCKIYDSDTRLIINFPGFTCQFLPSGEWLALFANDLFLYSKDNIVKYKFPYKVHHELKVSNDQKKFYFLSSEIKMFKGLKTRFDVINVSDINGRLLASWNTFDHIAEIYEKFSLKIFDNHLPHKMDDKNFAPDEQMEFTHFNAIYEIPKNPLESKYHYMKAGNLLVTLNGLGGVGIFDPELKKIEHIFPILKTSLNGLHDGQILPNGHLIIFRNYNERQNAPFTTIDEYDIPSGKLVWSFEFTEPRFTYNNVGGAVQVLDNDNVLITDNSFGGRAIEIDRSGKTVFLKFNDSLDQKMLKPIYMYRARKVNLDQFFKNNPSGNLSNAK